MKSFFGALAGPDLFMQGIPLEDIVPVDETRGFYAERYVTGTRVTVPPSAPCRYSAFSTCTPRLQATPCTTWLLAVPAVRLSKYVLMAEGVVDTIRAAELGMRLAGVIILRHIHKSISE